MKILKIFGAVIIVHVIAFLFIFASPGCQSSSRSVPTPDATVSGDMGTTAPVNYTTVAAESVPMHNTYTAPSTYGRAEPTRPGSPNAAAIAPARAAVADVAPVSTYSVTRGDSLWSIAKKHHLTVTELAKANNLSTGATLQPGQKLIVPAKAVSAQDLATASAAPAKMSDAKSSTPVRGNDALRHTIQSGESLGAIARKYQVSVGELAAANSITDPAKIRAGQQLVIPGFKAVSNSRPSSTTAAETSAAAATATPAAESASNAVPRFEISAPPPGQDLDAALNEVSTEVPTIKVEDVRTPPRG